MLLFEVNVLKGTRCCQLLNEALTYPYSGAVGVKKGFKVLIYYL